MSLPVAAVGSGLLVNAGDAQVLAWHQARYHVRRAVAALPQCSLTSEAGLGGAAVSPVREGLDQVLRSYERSPRTMS